jgi:hypothetical protein
MSAASVNRILEHRDRWRKESLEFDIQQHAPRIPAVRRIPRGSCETESCRKTGGVV